MALKTLKNWLGTDRAVKLTILILCLFYLFTIRAGHNWGCDFASYLHHAENILQGRSYSDVNYVFNRFNPIAPRTQPPLFPLMLALVYLFFGLNFTAFKVMNILLFMLALYFIYKVLAAQKEKLLAWLTVAFIGLHQFYWSFKENILTDLPFVLFCYLAIFFIQKAVNSIEKKEILLNACFAAFLVSLAYGIRAIGIVFVPVVLGYEFLKKKRLTRASGIILGLFAGFYLLQGAFFHTAGENIRLFQLSLPGITNNLRMYRVVMVLFWNNGYWVRVGAIFALVSIPIFFYGHFLSLKKGLQVAAVFFWLYLVTVLVWPYMDGPRFFFPLFPLYVYYLFLGVKGLSLQAGRIFNPKLGLSLRAGLILIFFLPNLTWYTASDLGKPLESGVFIDTSQEMFGFIGTATPKNSVIIFFKPRAMGFFAKRPASVYHVPQDDRHLWNYLKEINASYVVVHRGFPLDLIYLNRFISRHPESFRRVFSNRDFRVYRIVKR